MQRESTGIPKLDQVIHGGLPRPSIIALVGSPGAGTTSFCKNFIVSSLLRGSRVLVALGDEPQPQYIRNLSGIKDFDIQTYIDQKLLFFLDQYAEYTKASGIQIISDLPIPEILQAEKVMIASRDSMVEQMGVSNKKFNVVIDSVTAFSPFMSIREMHQVIQNAQVMAAENNHIMIFAAHEGALEGNLVQVVRQYADGVIRLRTRWVRGKLRREMLIEKMRFTEISEPVLEYRIGSEGIEIL